MAKAKKIKKEELTKIQEQQVKLKDLLSNIGILESQKHGLLHEIAVLNKDIEEYKIELEETYGQININLEDGLYEEIKKEDVPGNKKD
jgi:hypothetical protein